jgi:hypothetical protein
MTTVIVKDRLDTKSISTALNRKKTVSRAQQTKDRRERTEKAAHKIIQPYKDGRVRSEKTAHRFV